MKNESTASNRKQLQSDPGGSTAFIFAGGGSLGAVQVGMLRALVQENICPDFLVGSSVGALNAAFFALKPTLEGVVELANLWNSVRRSEVFPVHTINGIRAFFQKQAFLCDASGLTRILASKFPKTRFEDLSLHCTVVATELYEGREVQIEEGSLQTALLASVAIPVVFPPIEHNGSYLIDGGISNNTPISCAVERGAKRIIVFPTGLSCALQRRPSSIIEISLHTLNMLVARRLIQDIQAYHLHTDIFVIPPLCPMEVNLFDFSHSTELIDRAELATQDWLQQPRHHHDLAPPTLAPHHH